MTRRPHAPLAASVVALVLAVAACSKPFAFHATTYDPPEPAPSVVLPTATGATFSLAQQRGKVVLLYFGYTHCPDVCPTTLADWARIRRSLGATANGVKFVFVSVDPARDTPAAVAQYASRFDPSFIGLTGDTSKLHDIETAFQITSSREGDSTGTSYAVVHSSYTFVIDPKGKLRLLVPFGIAPADLASDVRALADGG